MFKDIICVTSIVFFLPLAFVDNANAGDANVGVILELVRDNPAIEEKQKTVDYDVRAWIERARTCFKTPGCDDPHPIYIELRDEGFLEKGN